MIYVRWSKNCVCWQVRSLIDNQWEMTDLPSWYKESDVCGYYLMYGREVKFLADA